MQANQPPFLGSEEAIIAHLFYATVEIEIVTVQVGRQGVPGTMTWPDADTRTIGFVPDVGELDGAAPPRPGRVVRVQYASLNDEYSFLATLKSVEPGSWRLSIPRQVDRTDRRLLPRAPVLNSRKFTLQLRSGRESARHLLVVDISPAGLALVYDPRLDDFEKGKAYLGLLNVPNHPGMRLRFEVVDIRTLGDDKDQSVIGASFQGLGFAGCRTLAEILAIWED
jgi:hypothetical protein